MQLFAGMINAAPSSSSPQDLTAMAFESDAQPLTESADTNTDDTDGDKDEADALAMAALLPGLMSTAVPAPGTGAPGTGAQSTDGPSVDIVSLTTAGVAADGSDDALVSLADNTADAAGNVPLGNTDSSAAPVPSPTINTAHMHALLNSHAAASADAIADGVVQAPVGSPDWKDELGTHLTWMAVNGREAASLRLSPEHLGPVEVRISVDDGKASVYFGAANADTRNALEQSLPRLRELFASQGMVLADAGVSRDAPRNQFKPSASPGGSRSSSDAGVEASVKSVTLTRAGLIDTYV